MDGWWDLDFDLDLYDRNGKEKRKKIGDQGSYVIGFDERKRGGVG